MRRADDPLQLLPQPALPEVSRPGEAALAGATLWRVAAGAVLPHCLHRPGRAQLSGTGQPGVVLWSAVRQRLEDLAGDRGRPEAPRGAPRSSRRAAHLEPDALVASARALHRAGGRSVAGPAEVAGQPARLLPADPGVGAAVSRQASGRGQSGLEGREVASAGELAGSVHVSGSTRLPLP